MPKKKAPDQVGEQQFEELGVDFYTYSQTPEFFPTGSTLLDLTLGGGWCENKVLNIIGDSATGKSLLAVVAAKGYANKYPDRHILYVETEAAFNPLFAKSIGIPEKNTFFPQGISTVEGLFTLLDKVVERKLPCLVIVDSLDALSTEEELEGDFSAGYHGARKAERMSSLFRQINTKLSETSVTLMIISQIRDKIGVLWGRKWTRAGGRALDFYASQVLVLAVTSKLTKTVSKDKRVVGVNVKAAPDKSRLSAPFRAVDFPILFNGGIQDEHSCKNWLKSAGLALPPDVELKGFMKRAWEEMENKFNDTSDIKEQE